MKQMDAHNLSRGPSCSQEDQKERKPRWKRDSTERQFRKSLHGPVDFLPRRPVPQREGVISNRPPALFRPIIPKVKKTRLPHDFLGSAPPQIQVSSGSSCFAPALRHRLRRRCTTAALNFLSPASLSLSEHKQSQTLALKYPFVLHVSPSKRVFTIIICSVTYKEVSVVQP